MNTWLHSYISDNFTRIFAMAKVITKGSGWHEDIAMTVIERILTRTPHDFEGMVTRGEDKYFLSVCIKNAWIDHNRKESRIQTTSTDGVEHFTSLDTDFEIDRIEHLNWFEGELYHLYFVQGLTTREIENETGINYASVSRYINSIKSKLIENGCF